MSTLRLFPLNAVLFPGTALKLHVFEPRYKQLLAECLDCGEAFGVCLIRDGDDAGDATVEPYDVGTTAEIADVTPLPFGRFSVSTTGGRRFRILEIISREPYLLCDVEYLNEEVDGDGDDIDVLLERVRQEFREYLRLLVEYAGIASEIEVPPNPNSASYVIGHVLQVADPIKQRLLEISSTRQRLRIELDFLHRLLPQLRALKDRRPAERATEPRRPSGGAARTEQERYFGKYFSAN
ncbi:MAG: LON peptidase substrate-binding domain-containing protein [Candidatus Eremiobacteraeota bacterium]|nr:LON peptidase substrate-binding domain-containing protein [Candidatus Eremiobacteraeota bacterium]MBV8354983.1 LON peptidase substrate-binding domain-containing protein [Candidatus Eremiobacteraeota bacterium]